VDRTEIDGGYGMSDPADRPHCVVEVSGDYEKREFDDGGVGWYLRDVQPQQEASCPTTKPE
jgi:hypothetical protein